MAEPEAGKVARDAAIREVVGTLAYIAVMGAVSLIILKRDVAVRLWMRVTTRPVPPAEAQARRAVAQLRRDIAAWEHRGGPPPRPRGLYEDR